MSQYDQYWEQITLRASEAFRAFAETRQICEEEHRGPKPNIIGSNANVIF